MSTSNNDILCREAEKQIREFLADWQASPYRWLQEIDVQVELVSRLRAMVASRPEGDSLQSSHSHRLKGFNPPLTFSRITCEPYVALPERDPPYAHPDIVIWDDEDWSRSQINSGVWPILWACEIKYTDKEPDSSDQDRLRAMLAAGKVHAACWLKMILKRTGQAESIQTTCEKDGRLTIITGMLKSE